MAMLTIGSEQSLRDVWDLAHLDAANDSAVVVLRMSNAVTFV